MLAPGVVRNAARPSTRRSRVRLRSQLWSHSSSSGIVLHRLAGLPSRSAMMEVSAFRRPAKQGDYLGDYSTHSARTRWDDHGLSARLGLDGHGEPVDLIRQKWGAITGARPTGRVAPSSDDDGEQPTPARLHKSRHAPGRMHGRDLRSDGSAPAGVGFVNGRRVRGMGGKLRGSRAEWTWHRLHVLAPHQRSQPVACVSQVTMAWKRSGVRIP